MYNQFDLITDKEVVMTLKSKSTYINTLKEAPYFNEIG